MRIETQSDLTCVTVAEGRACGSSLSLIEPRFDPAQTSEIVEGWLVCPECGAKYPIVCGLAIMVTGLGGYFQRNYSLIAQIALENDLHLSPAMRTYLLEMGAHLERAGRGEDDPRSLSGYLAAQYDRYFSPLERLPQNHPLAVLLKSYQERDAYHVIENYLFEHLKQGQRFLDVGCHVGRITRYAAGRGARAYGIDIAFAAAFVARRALCGWPAPLTEYEYFHDMWMRETRPLNLPPFEQGDVVIASGMELPFPADFFDAVACINVLDIVPNPIVLLKELRNSLKAGGIVALSTPYHTNAANAARQWLGDKRKMSTAQAFRWRIGHLYEVLAEEDDIPWILGQHDRHLQIYLNHCILGRKPAENHTGAV